LQKKVDPELLADKPAKKEDRDRDKRERERKQRGEKKTERRPGTSKA